MSENKDIFISYNWGIKDQVRELYKILTDNNYKVWMDENDLHNSDNPLTSVLATNIIKSAVFLCCITENYCKSYNCNLEIEYANKKRKPIVPLMIQRILNIGEIKIDKKNQTSGIDFIIT